MDRELERIQSNKAWSLAIAAWLVGAGLLYAIHVLVGELRSADLRWWLDAALFVVAFFYFLAIGPLHDLFLLRIYRRSSQP